MRRLAAAALALLAAAPAFAQLPAIDPSPQDPGLRPRRSEIELGGSRETLSGGRADWRSLSVDGAHTFAPRRTLYGGVRETERFGLRDTEASAGYYHPLSADWTALVEASVSDTHRVLARYAVFGQVTRGLGAGWSASAGLRHSEYTRSGVNLAVLGLERYWGDFRAGYTLYAGRPEGANTGVAHRLSFSYYYGDGSSVGVAGTSGREVENVGPPTGITSTGVRNLSLTGRHWFSPDWAVSWDLGAHEQGNLYRREGFRLGLRHRF